MSIRKQLRLDVERRAGNCCEYCQMHQSLQGATFHVEHVVPIVQGGTDELSNLALACPSCNLHKSDRTHATTQSGATLPLFNPREHRWAEHFTWDEYAIVGRTEIGTATIAALDLNQVRRLQIRQAEQRLGLFPASRR